MIDGDEASRVGGPGRRVGRRTVLAGLGGLGALAVAGTAGVATGVLPGRTRLYTLLDEVLPVPTPGHGVGQAVTGSFVSAARRGARVGWTVAYPPGAPAGRLPVVLALHGQGGDSSVLPALHVPGFLADAVAAGAAPFAVAAADGGRGYWHRRRDGEDAQAMLVDEFLPLLDGLVGPSGQRLAAGAGDRIGLIGWSAGGYGALLLGERLGAARVAAVVAASPALWTTAQTPVEGAFDDAADRAAHDPFAARDGLRRVRIRIDCGAGDPFLEASQAFARVLDPPPVTSWGTGAHDASYWQRLLPDQLPFLAGALSGSTPGA